MSEELPPINFIDDSFDTDLSVDSLVKLNVPISKPISAMERLIKLTQFRYNRAQDCLQDKVVTSALAIKSVKTITSTNITRSPAMRFSTREARKMDKSSPIVPKYSPPSDESLFALQELTKDYTDWRPILPRQLISNQPRLEKPTVPKAKTNTNLCNYLHKLYVYEQKTSKLYSTRRAQFTIGVDEDDDEEEYFSASSNFDKINESFSVKRMTLPSPVSNYTLPSPNSTPSLKRTVSAAVSPKSATLERSRSSRWSEGTTLHHMATGDIIALKHHYDPNLSKVISRSMSLKNFSMRN